LGSDCLLFGLEEQRPIPLEVELGASFIVSAASFILAVFYYEYRKPDNSEWFLVAGFAFPFFLSCLVSPSTRKSVSRLIDALAETVGKSITTKFADSLATIVVGAATSIIAALVAILIAKK
jgi:hypothetical protein